MVNTVRDDINHHGQTAGRKCGNRVHFFTLFSGALMALLGTQPGYAAAGDTFQPYLGYTYTYDDNLFRVPAAQGMANGKSDSYRRADGGMMIDKSIGLQHMTASLNVSRTSFNQYTQLDNDARDLQGNWNWHIGNHLEGNLGASNSQSLTPYTEFHNTERNVRTQRREFFDTAWTFHPSWRLRGAMSHYELAYDLSTQKFGDRTEEESEIGLDFIASSNSSIGVVLRRTRGQFPTPQLIGPLMVDNSYTQDEYKARIDWIFSGKTRMQFLGGWTQRKHDSFPARDTSGPSARLIFDWLPGGKTGVNVTAWRDINASDDLTASYTLNKGLAIAPKWDVLAKVRMDGLLKYEKRDFSGATAFTTLLPSNRQDRSRYVSLGLTYFPAQYFQVGVSVYRDELSSNVTPVIDYRANGAMINLRSVF